ncbi:hypothetical protein [Streptomyces sp. NPDC020965]|uniref:hypothetical protein n=1 Tax=Streptomyces sp. NPDC020965 TaxID=3365105 RepID=UPI0037B2C01D
MTDWFDMAWICPRCKRPEAVAYVANEEGLHTFPCLFCDFSTLSGPALTAIYASTACAAPHCEGSVTDVFHYDSGMRLIEVTRRVCPSCGSRATASARQPPHRRGPKLSPAPRP